MPAQTARELLDLIRARPKQLDYSTWYGIWLPSATPRAIANRLFDATEKLVLSAEVKEEFASQGVDAVLMPPERFDVFCRSEIGKWAKVIRATGARPE